VFLYTVAFESQKFFKRVFYLKQINFITGGPLAAGGPGQLPPLPSLNPALHPWCYLLNNGSQTLF